MKKITAICEIKDQYCAIKCVRIIDNTEEAKAKFANDMEEQIGGWLGYWIYFYDAIYPNPDADEYESVVYKWMDDHKHTEIDHDY